MAFERTSGQTFFGVSALVFVASTAVTIVWSASMSDDGWHADARRLVNVHDLDARAGLVWRGVVVSRDVGRDDDFDDDAIPGCRCC